MSMDAAESRKSKSQKPKDGTGNREQGAGNGEQLDRWARSLIPVLCCLVCILTTLSLPACNEPPAINPWVDDSISQEKWYTPSSDSVLIAKAEPAIRHRPIAPSTMPAVDESVPHYPLWWEDSFEDQGDRDNVFAWTWQDYLAMPGSYGRLIVNTLAVPASAILQPPGSSMVSDGHLEQRGLSEHDAKRGHSPDPTADKSDFGFDEEDEPLPLVTSAPS